MTDRAKEVAVATLLVRSFQESGLSEETQQWVRLWTILHPHAPPPYTPRDQRDAAALTPREKDQAIETHSHPK